ncbi:hypothetical protein IV500_18605 [Paeniglutamicibacter antarcticus]|uniref:Uncharacterized protein n=1 Tax=Arthrobacter terrae TaxID=2935737 RepID=A0A931CQW9_9MICC|nr:hypothetical protein [Arthrobacter terrae]MBG0741377.1 hypothetical protein [Arthrobacter terrae]
MKDPGLPVRGHASTERVAVAAAIDVDTAVHWLASAAEITVFRDILHAA